MGRNDPKGIFIRTKNDLIMKRKFAILLFWNRFTRMLRPYVVLLGATLLWTGETYGFGEKKSPEQYEKTVEELFDRKAWDKGMELLKEGLRLYPESSELNGLAGAFYYRQQDYVNARYFLVRAVRTSSDNVEAKSLLINVEEQTGNYSSAICYVNELLETAPYWPGLWKRKIGLYRKQGNDAEADRILKRLFQIYPNDSLVRKDYLARLEENYLRERRNGNRAAAVKQLQELLENDRSDATRYLDLANLLLQEGNPEAGLNVVSEGVQQFPCSEPLVAKKAEILSGLQRYSEALAFLDERIAACRDIGRLSRLRDAITGEYALARRNADPYRLYGALYDRTRNPEALDYLLGEALRSGRNEDAKRYLAEARRLRGDSPELRYKEYDLYRRSGSPKATLLLERLYESDPGNRDIAEELCAMRYAQAETHIREEAYDEAIEDLAFVSEHAPDPELQIAALKKSHSLLLLYKRPDAAKRVLERMKTGISREEYAIRTAQTEAAAGNPSAALGVLYEYLLADETSEMSRIRNTYEEIAVPYIKSLLESGDRRNACRESRRAVVACPDSEPLLLYAAASHEQAGDRSAADDYIRRGLQQFPANPIFTGKKAASLYAEGRYEEAVGILIPRVDSLPGNRDLVAALSAGSEALARERIRSGKLDEAMGCIDTALHYDPDNRNLLLVKGVVHEKRERYDSAYLFQCRYRPEAAEAKAFEQHLIGLQHRELKNELSMGVLCGGYLNGRSFAPVTEITYAHTNARNRFFIAPSYTARERAVDSENENLTTEGGQGIRIVAGWERRIARRWNLSLAAGWANAYFPTLSAAASVSRDFNREWTLGLNLGYRSLDRDQIDYRWYETTDGTSEATQGNWVAERYVQVEEQLFNAGLTATKSFESLVLTLKGEAFVMGGQCYANGSAQFKYLPGGDRISFIRASAGIGNAPELDVIDRALPGCFDRINFSASIGAGYLVGKHMLIGIDLSCSTLYTQDGIRTGSYDDFTEDIRTEYKNTLNANMYVAFRF